MPLTRYDTAQAREVGALLRRNGFPAARKRGSRVRGAPWVTPGYTATTWRPMEPNRADGSTANIVTVTWETNWELSDKIDLLGQRREKESAIERVLTDAGYSVTRGIMGLHVDLTEPGDEK